MKIFNVEDGKKVAYVQIQDIQMMMNYASFVPKSLMSIILEKTFVCDEFNRFDFMKFTDIEAVQYFELMDWIPEYKSVRNAKEEEVINYGEFLSGQIKSLKELIDKKQENIHTSKHYSDLALMTYKLSSITDILLMNRGLKSMPIPEVPDNTKKGKDIEDKYYAINGINPLQILIGKKDHTPFNENDSLTLQSFNEVYGIGIDDNIEHNEFFEYTGADWKLSNDKMYYVITLAMKHVPFPERKETFKDRFKKLFTGKKAK